MPNELIDICDEKNRPTGIQKSKDEVHRAGLWHRNSHIWIYNSKGEILIQLRAKGKALHPNVWDISAAGHVSAGEDPIISGLREVREEIGLKLQKKDLDLFMIKKHQSIFKEIKNNVFYYIYFLKFDGEIKKLKLQKEEVQKIKFIPINKIKEELERNPSHYVPHGDYWFEVIDEVKRRLKNNYEK